MVNINSVRNSILAICNKNNYGYISPSDFNLFAKVAQIEIFAEYMKLYNYYINRENDRTSGSDLADVAEKAREDIEVFVTEAGLINVPPTTNGFSIFTEPSDLYHLNLLTYALAAPSTKTVKIDKVSRLDAAYLANANLCPPTLEHPVFAQSDGKVRVLPLQITSSVNAVYIRYPLVPTWGYLSLSSGEPVYDLATSQDFEVAGEDEPRLVQKILEVAGLSIREPDVYRFAEKNDNTIQQ